MSEYFITNLNELKSIYEDCDTCEDCGMSGLHYGYNWITVKKNEIDFNIYFKYVEEDEEKERYFVVEVSDSKNGDIPVCEGTIEEIKKSLIFNTIGIEEENEKEINKCKTIDDFLEKHLFGDKEYKEVNILDYLIASEKHRF